MIKGLNKLTDKMYKDVKEPQCCFEMWSKEQQKMVYCGESAYYHVSRKKYLCEKHKSVGVG